MGFTTIKIQTKMKKYKLILAVFIAFLAVNATAQDLMTLEKTLEVAYQNSPEMIKQKTTLENQRENVNATKANLKSRFSLSVNPISYDKRRAFENYANDYVGSETLGSSGSFNIRQPITATNGEISLSNQFGFERNIVGDNAAKSSFSNNLQLSINQPLLKKYNTNKMGLLKAELDLETAQLNYSIIKLSLEYRVSQFFYSVYSAQQNLTTANEELSNQKKSYEIIKNKVSAGLSAEEELWQAELNLQNAESSVNDSEVALENSKDRLKQAIGLGLNSDFSVLANIEVKTINVKLEDAIAYGLQKRMELRQNEITLENSRMNLLQVQDNDKISGSIQLSVGLQGINEQFQQIYNTPSDNESVALLFNIPIWDWGARKSRIKIAENNLKTTEIDQEQEKINIEMEIRQTFRNLKNLVYQIAIAEKSVENAQKTYELNLEKYQNGDLTSMDLKQFSDQLTQKRNSLTTARINYKLGLLNLKNQTLWDFETNKSILPSVYSPEFRNQ
jgi:outer membrane protein